MSILLQMPADRKPLPLDPPDPQTEASVKKAIAYGQLARAAAGLCPLCLAHLTAAGNCPDELCLCHWWGSSAPGTIGDPRR